MYPAVWALMRWARDAGATWFDFSGLTNGASTSGDDPLGGISEFKLNFGREDLTVGEDSALDLAPLRQRLASAVSSGLSFLNPRRG